MMLDQQTHSSNGLAPLSGHRSRCPVAHRPTLSLFQRTSRAIWTRQDAATPLFAEWRFLAGRFFLCMTAAHLCVWLWPQIPLFAAYGVIGAVLAIIGGSLVWVGKSKFDTFNLLAEKSVEGLRECPMDEQDVSEVRWKKHAPP